MYLAFLQQAATANTNSSDEVVGGIILFGLAVWFVVWLCSDKDKGWTYRQRTTGTLTKNK